jgi:hypothetical protein
MQPNERDVGMGLLYRGDPVLCTLPIVVWASLFSRGPAPKIIVPICSEEISWLHTRGE